MKPHVLLASTLLTGMPTGVWGVEQVPQGLDALFDLAPEKEAVVSPAAKPAPEILPLTKDTLFAEPVGEKREAVNKPVETGPEAATPGPEVPASKDALFDLADAPPPAEPRAPASANATPAQASGPLRGFIQTELSRTYASPAHWSKAMGRLELGTQGKFDGGAKWKLSGRVDYNAAYDWGDHYQSQVRHDQRTDFQIRETYVDFSAGTWDWRVGRQHVVWGEMVGMFLADVVSAKDMREFILQDFHVMRIPQWAARAEYFGDDFHAELLWIPFPSYDEIGKPADFTKPGFGGDFYAYPPVPGVPVFLPEDKPSTSLEHTNLGARISRLQDGWDLSGFVYTSMNAQASYHLVAPNTYRPRHDRIWQAGGSLAKDLGPMVLKAEAVYTRGRRLNLTTTGEAVKQPMLDWAIGLDFNPDVDTRLNVQFFQSRIFDHEAAVLPDAVENGASLYVTRELSHNWRAELLWMRSLNRTDWMVRPKMVWGFQPNWKLSFGVDIFSGPPTGFFGQFDQQDRAYAEIRYDF